MLTRFPDWPERLAAFLTATRDVPFEWGVNDCALRTCDAVKATTGADLAEPLRGRYRTKLGAARAILRACGGDLEDLAEQFAFNFAIREVQPSYARRGDVVLLDTPLGPTLGIVDMTGITAEFKVNDGVLCAPVASCRRAWRVG
jgi:hypothetical protein